MLEGLEQSQYLVVNHLHPFILQPRISPLVLKPNCEPGLLTGWYHSLLSQLSPVLVDFTLC